MWRRTNGNIPAPVGISEGLRDWPAAPDKKFRVCAAVGKGRIYFLSLRPKEPAF